MNAAGISHAGSPSLINPLTAFIWSAECSVTDARWNHVRRFETAIPGDWGISGHPIPSHRLINSLASGGGQIEATSASSSPSRETETPQDRRASSIETASLAGGYYFRRS